MATSKQDGPRIRYDAFIKQVKPDAADTGQVVMMQGYVGESALEGNLRLYSDASLAHYADIPVADIVHSIPNTDDPLGGSRLWVKQSAQVQYNDAASYGQGDMYNDYMANAYAPGIQGDFGTAATTNPAICLQPQITLTAACRTFQFVVCRPTIVQVQCITRNGNRTLCRPCWETPVTITRPTTTVTFTVTGPGTIHQGAAMGDTGYGDYSDYTGGDMYNNYMTNAFANAGYGAMDGGITAGCQPVTLTTNCGTLTIPRTVQAWRCLLPVTRPPACPIGCVLQTRMPQVTIGGCPSFAGCPSIACTPQTINPTPGLGGVRGFDDPYGGADYAGGDLYNNYMQTGYDGGYDAMNQAAGTLNAVCAQPAVTIACPPSRVIVCQQTAFVPCRTRNIRQCITPRGYRTICRPCFQTPNITPQTPVIGQPGQGFNEADTGAYGDYTGGEMYNDYMGGDYMPNEGAMAGAAAATMPAGVCITITNPGFPPCRRPITNPAFPPCRVIPTNPNMPPCNRFTRNHFPPCGITRTLAAPLCGGVHTIACQTQACGQQGFGEGYDAANPYGYGY